MDFTHCGSYFSLVMVHAVNIPSSSRLLNKIQNILFLCNWTEYTGPNTTLFPVQRTKTKNDNSRKIQPLKRDGTYGSNYCQVHTLYLFLSTYKEVLLLFCDNTEFGVAESPAEVEADPRKLPVPEISCQLQNHAQHERIYKTHVFRMWRNWKFLIQCSME